MTDGAVDVTRGAACCTTSGAGAGTLRVTGVRADVTGAATSGASGVGSGTADSAVRLVVAVPVFDPLARVVFVLDGVSVEGGSSGAGIGVPPAARPAAG